MSSWHPQNADGKLLRGSSQSSYLPAFEKCAAWSFFELCDDAATTRTPRNQDHDEGARTLLSADGASTEGAAAKTAAPLP